MQDAFNEHGAQTRSRISERPSSVHATWSTFADPEAEPDGIDFEGLNAIALFRQPLVR